MENDPTNAVEPVGAPRLRLLLLITGLGLGGAEKAVFTLATGLDRSRFDVRVACLLDRGPYAERLEAAGIPVHALAMSGRTDVGAFWRLRALLRQHRPAILHTFLFHANLLGRFAAWSAGTPVRISSVRVCEEERPSHLWWDRWTQGLIHAETCVGEAVRRFTRERARIRDDRLVVIANAVQAQAPTPDARVRLRQADRLEEQDVLVLGVGRLDTQKAPEDLVRATLAVAAPPLRLWIAGTGPREETLRAALACADAGDRARLLGRRTDVPDLLAAADVFALASRWEGMPNAVLEAMAAGLPVVATAVGGTTDLVLDGETGFLVPPGDLVAFSDRLRRLALDPALRRKLGEAGRARAESCFGIPRFLAAHATLYERLWQTHGPARR